MHGSRPSRISIDREPPTEIERYVRESRSIRRRWRKLAGMGPETFLAKVDHKRPHRLSPYGRDFTAGGVTR